MRLDPLVKPRSVATGIVIATDRGGPGCAAMQSLGTIGLAVRLLTNKLILISTRQRTAYAT
jgi:hypothetical protein